MSSSANPGVSIPEEPHYDVYLMPGLGLDEQIFANISLRKGRLCRMYWLEPEPNEELLAYVHRLSTQVESTGRPRVLIGHSFGGIVVQELQRVIKADKLVLISTLTSAHEMPFNLRLLKYTRLHYLIRTFLLIQTLQLWGLRHGYDTKKLRGVFKSAAGRLSSRYFRWAVDQVVCWQPVSLSCPVLRIHGSRDRTFPIKPEGIFTIEDGDHLLVYKHGSAISRRIDDFLTGINTGIE
jgi:pimeloyl-ACP methyl ester carboxylesterase